MVEWLEQLEYGTESRRKVVRSRLTGTSFKLGKATSFKLEKAKAAKGEGWAPPFISCAQDTVGL